MSEHVQLCPCPMGDETFQKQVVRSLNYGGELLWKVAYEQPDRPKSTLPYINKLGLETDQAELLGSCVSKILLDQCPSFDTQSVIPVQLKSRATDELYKLIVEL